MTKELSRKMKFLICYFLCLGTALAYPNLLGYNSEEILSGEQAGQHAGTKSTNCSCGWTNKRRVVGGKETLKNEFPLMSGIVDMKQKTVFCGATILTVNHAITASHCTVPYKGKPLGLLVGGHDTTQADKDSEVVPIKSTIEHENYDPDTFFNDIAILVLSRPIKFNQFVGPACLPKERFNLVNEQLKVLGWGRIKHKGATSNVLMKLDLKVFPINTCRTYYIRKIETQNPFQVCTFRKGRDSCQGDSGGPLIWLDPETNRYTLAALVSYGKSCASKSPAVNTEVAFFLDWIQDKIASTGLEGKTCSKQ